MNEIISYETILLIHYEVAGIDKNQSGVESNKKGLLESLVYMINHNDYYPTRPEKITYIILQINKSHIFRNCNKRTTLFLILILLSTYNPKITKDNIVSIGHRATMYINIVAFGNTHKEELEPLIANLLKNKKPLIKDIKYIKDRILLESQYHEIDDVIKKYNGYINYYIFPEKYLIEEN